MINSDFFYIKNNFLTLKKVIEITGAQLSKDLKKIDLSRKIYGVSALDNSASGEISFLGSAKYIDDFKSSNAGFCFLEEKHLLKMPKTMIGLIHPNPYFAYSIILNEFYDDKKFISDNKISSKATMEKSVIIGNNTKIMDGVYIGHNVEIGDNCYIGANSVISDSCKIGNNTVIYSLVSISYTKIGDNTIIHNGAKIGQDGFGFVHNQGINHKILQLGIVVIGNNVEIGANSCIDRGAIDNTIISDGVKIDNLVQIAHNVIIGEGTVICGCSAIAGSTKIGKFVQIGGRCSINGHITIGDGVQIAGASGVVKTVAPMQVVAGIPAVPIKDWHRMNIKLMRLVKDSNKIKN